MAAAETMAPAACPAPGLYPGVPAAEYHRWDAASNSRLTTLARSPMHLRAEVLAPRAPTPAMELGTAAHAAILEPEYFPETYVVAGRCEAFTGRGTRCRNQGTLLVGDGSWYCSVSGHAPAHGREDLGERKVIGADVQRACEGMRAAVLAHPAASALLANATHTELSAVWDQDPDFDAWARQPGPGTGVRCKLRADGYVHRLDLVFDLKTTEDASPAAFSRHLFQMGYHRQAALYLRGLAAVGLPATAFAFIAVESKPPHAVGVYRLDDNAVEAGAHQVRQLLSRYRECLRTGEWPGYSDLIQDLTLPAWAWNQLDF